NENHNDVNVEKFDMKRYYIQSGYHTLQQQQQFIFLRLRVDLANVVSIKTPRREEWDLRDNDEASIEVTEAVAF
ncbi:hypothetical protein HHI36_004524, partial [Cryptolaemus montrouzieri]